MTTTPRFPTDPSKVAQNAGNPAPGFKLDGMVMETKYDGFRLLAHIDSDGVHLYTRTGSEKTKHAPHITAALEHLPAGTWLDGEVIVLDADGFPEWGKVQSIFGGNPTRPGVHEEAVYMVFDVMAFDGNDIRPLPLSVRRDALEAIIPAEGPARLTPQRPASQAAHDALVAEGWEGSIVKDLSKPYASGKRGHGWTKLKANDEMDVVIMGYKPGENSFSGMVGAIIFGQFKDGVLVERGRCSGMDMKMRKTITAAQPELVGSVISIAYMGIMPSGSPRHPQYKRFRTDKPAQDCVWT